MSYPVSVVPFHGDSVTTLDADGSQYVALKPICEALGVDRKRQQEKIQTSERWGHMSLPCQTPGGVQKMLCIPLHKLNGWLFSINPNKVRPDLKEKVIQYQEECFYAIGGHRFYGRRQKVGAYRISQAQLEQFREFLKVGPKEWHARIEQEEKEQAEARKRAISASLNKTFQKPGNTISQGSKGNEK